LRKNEIVEPLLVELGTHRRFSIFPQSKQLGEAIVVAVRLTRSAIGVAFHFFLGECRRLHHIPLEHALGIGRLNLAGLQLRIEERPCRPQEPIVKRD
jgi:hypothetical protein